MACLFTTTELYRNKGRGGEGMGGEGEGEGRMGEGKGWEGGRGRKGRGGNDRKGVKEMEEGNCAPRQPLFPPGV